MTIAHEGNELSPDCGIKPERFWAKVDVGQDGCWAWLGARKKNGYGTYSFGSNTKHYVQHAHRLAFCLSRKETIPAGMHVLHTCDNPICCRPAHLYLGSRSDNMKDMHAKGRGRKNYTKGRTPTNARPIMGFGVRYPSATAAANVFGITKQAALQRARRNWQGWCFA